VAGRVGSDTAEAIGRIEEWRQQEERRKRGIGRVNVHHNSDYSGMAIVSWSHWSVEIPAGILVAAAEQEVQRLRDELESEREDRRNERLERAEYADRRE
jgi:hypothetical protein